MDKKYRDWNIIVDMMLAGKHKKTIGKYYSSTYCMQCIVYNSDCTKCFISTSKARECNLENSSWDIFTTWLWRSKHIKRPKALAHAIHIRDAINEYNNTL